MNEINVWHWHFMNVVTKSKVITKLDICHDYIRFAFIALSSSTSQLKCLLPSMAKVNKSSWNWLVKKKYQRHKNDQNTQNSYSNCQFHFDNFQSNAQKHTHLTYVSNAIGTYVHRKYGKFIEPLTPNTTWHSKYQSFRDSRCMRAYREYI